jgi:hypothetical protein
MSTFKGVDLLGIDISTFQQYLRAWFNAVRRGALDMFGSISTVAGFGLWWWNRHSPDSFMFVVSYFGVTPDVAMSDLVWQIPVGLGLLALSYRFIRAPYEIHLAMHSALTKAETELVRQQAEEHGIELACSEISLSWEDHADLPPGVLVALDVERIVNGNSRDAVLDVKLVAPLWRRGAFAVNTSSRPLLHPIGSVVARRPLLPPLINLPKKQGIGPGYFLFFFSYQSWKEMSFIPNRDRQGNLGDFAKLISDSELLVEFVDRGNNILIPPFPAPGTLRKRFDRQQREAKERPSSSGSSTPDQPPNPSL